VNGTLLFYGESTDAEVMVALPGACGIFSCTGLPNMAAPRSFRIYRISRAHRPGNHLFRPT